MKHDKLLARYFAAYQAANGTPAPFTIAFAKGYFYRLDLGTKKVDGNWHGVKQLTASCEVLEQRAKDFLKRIEA